MGLEDAAALATLLPLGISAESEDIPKRLEVFEEIRKPRVEWLSKISADRADVTKRKESGKYLRDLCMSRTDTHTGLAELNDDVFGYDVVKVINTALKEQMNA
jgi:2-polyprenyl-6-methoxyphenol hydroxylase-like FAD-dependent oxidoreductase